MSKVGRPAFCEDMTGDSEDNRTVRESRQSASIRKKEKEHRGDRPSRREKKSHSDDGNSIRVPKDDDEVTTVEKIRVIPDPRDHRDSRRRSNASTPSARAHRKSHSRPATTSRGVTFEAKDAHRISKDDPRYFGRRGGEDTVEQPSRRARPPLALPSHTAPARPTSFHARPPLSASATFGQPHVIYPAAVPVAASPIVGSMYSNYGGSYFPERPHGGMAERFMRTGNFPTTRPLSTAEYYEEPRQIEYYDDEEDDYDSEEEREAEREAERIRQEEEREAAREAENKKREKELRRKERALKEREEKLEKLQLQELERLRAQERERERMRDRETMPPPSLPMPGDMRRRLSMRSKPPPSIDDYPTFEDARDIPIRRRALENRRHSRDFMPGSYTRDEEVTIPMRPRITYRETEPVAPPQHTRRQSLSRAPGSAASIDFLKGNSDIRVEGRGRRASVYSPNSGASGVSGVSTSSSNWEEKEAAAHMYQKDISGEPPKLTAEVLRKQQNTIASSRSTRSSGSRDESDVRQSVTTRTTRSGSGTGTEQQGGGGGGGEYTIQIKGAATLNIPGGGTLTTDGEPVELTIRGNPHGGEQRKALRNGSEASRSEYAPSLPSAVSASEERAERRERRRQVARSREFGAPAALSDTMASMRDRRYGVPGDYGSDYF